MSPKGMSVFYKEIKRYGVALKEGISKHFLCLDAENGAYPPTLNGLIHPVLPLNWP